MNRLVLLFSFCFLLVSTTDVYSQTDPTKPNILLIIADDMGTDITPGYLTGNSPMPVTPHLDDFRANGITFTNAWATPQCAPTRATIMSGKYGNNNGVEKVPGTLDPTAHSSIFKELATETSSAYADAVVGKWHLDENDDYTHPAQHGVDYYTGVYKSGVDNYYNWDKLVGTSIVNETEYATKNLTDDAIDWIKARTSPWFMWMAHVAPHAPTHVPPAGTYSIGNTDNNFRKYVAAVESMDYEIGRMLDSIPPAVLANTLIIFIGDNGTPGTFLKSFPAGRGKGSMYQGGLNVPLIVSGAGVTRTGVTESAMINATDIYATILEAAGASLPGGKYNSFSFHPLLSSATATKRPYNYIDYQINGTNGDDFAIRTDQYKLIQYADGRQEFYDLIADPFESNNLLPTLTAAQQLVYDDLEVEAVYIRTDWSCRDLIQNGTETSIDLGGTYCAGLPVCMFDNSTNTTNIGCCDAPDPGESVFSEAIHLDERLISSNNFPDHNYCYNSPSQAPDPVNYVFSLDLTPTLAASKTSITNPSTKRPSIYFGVSVDGVLLAPAPASPFIFENTRTGEFNWDWIFEPTNNQGSGPTLVGLDCASAHTGGQGYHYHGNMFQYAEKIQTGLSTTTTPPAGPVHIGWAADGFPILYRFAPDGVGGLALLQPSYQLKPGDRPGDGVNSPCGPHNGKYTNDYEYIAGSGDLDECNGISRNVTINTICGPQTFDYFYVVTDDFPQISRCFSGTPSVSFNNDNRGGPCYKSLAMQKVTLNVGESITVGTNTYNSVGEYRDTIDNYNASCDSIVVTRVEAVLPLSLLEFRARVINNKSVYLNWTTTAEWKTSHFVIQRSRDFRTWEDLGQVKTKGDLTSTSYYSFEDELKDVDRSNDMTLYYRLKMVDLDESFEYSDIQSASLAADTKAHLVFDRSQGKLFIQSDWLQQKELQVTALDVQGRIIHQKTLSVNQGRNLVWDNMSDWIDGAYFIHLTDQQGVHLTRKMIVH